MKQGASSAAMLSSRTLWPLSAASASAGELAGADQGDLRARAKSEISLRVYSR